MARFIAVLVLLAGLASCAQSARHRQRLLISSTNGNQTSKPYGDGMESWGLIPPYAPNPLPGGVPEGSLDIPLNDPRLVKKVTGVMPEQVHLNVWAPGQLLVSWATGDGQVGPGGSLTPQDPSKTESVVMYGTASGKYTMNATGSAVVYYQNYSGYGSPYNLLDYTSPVLHHVLLKDITPGQTYYYRVGDPMHYAMSQEFNFTIPSNYPIKISVIADLGQTYNSSKTIDNMVSYKPDFVLFAGDLSYADNFFSNGTVADWLSNYTIPGPNPIEPLGVPYYLESTDTYQPRWDAWGRLLEPLFARAPVFAAPGNHETELQADGLEFASYSARFPQPQDTTTINTKPIHYFTPENPNNVNNMYAATEMPGGIFVISLSSYIPNDTFTANTTQYQWLEKTLQGVDRTKTPWLIAMWHHPWYNSDDAFKTNECMRQGYEDLLYKYGVDLVFNGHIHAYERSYPVYNWTRDDCGPVHIVVGSGGNDELLTTNYIDKLYQNTTTRPKYCNPGQATTRTMPDYQPQRCFSYQPSQYPGTDGYCFTEQPPWSAFRAQFFGSGVLEVLNSTHATWVWHNNLDAPDAQFDSTTFIRNLTCANKS